MKLSNRTKTALTTLAGGLIGAGPTLIKNRGNNPVLFGLGTALCALSAVRYITTDESVEQTPEKLTSNFIGSLAMGLTAGGIASGILSISSEALLEDTSDTTTEEPTES